MHKYNIKNFIKCHSIHVRKWFCGLLAAQIILVPNYSFAQINPDITVQQMNNSFGVSAFDLTNYNLALNLNFGSEHPDTTYAALTAVYRGLVNTFGPAYYYEFRDNNLNSPARYSETQNVLRSLQAVETNQWYMNQNLINIDSTNSSINSKINTLQTTVNSINSSLNTYAPDLYNINRALRSDLWSTLSYTPKYYNSSLNEISYSAYQNIGTDMYISTPDNTSILPNCILHIKLPISYMSNIQYLQIEFSNYRYGEIIVPYYYVVPSMWEVDLYYISPFNAVGSTYIHLHNDYGLRFTDTGISGQPLCEYIGPNNARYKEYLQILFDYQNHRELMDSLNNLDLEATISGDVNIDTSDLIDAINNLSLQDNDVKLNLTINNNTGSNGTNVINRLQNFFNTGTSISDFFDNVDDAESGWFTQTNSDLINTLSGGYVNLYE